MLGGACGDLVVWDSKMGLGLRTGTGLIVWLGGRFGRSVGRWIGGSVGRLVGWLVGWLVPLWAEIISFYKGEHSK